MKRIQRQARNRLLAFMATLMGLLIVALSFVATMILRLSSYQFVAAPTALWLVTSLITAGSIFLMRRKPLLTPEDSSSISGAEAVGPLLEMLRVTVRIKDSTALYAALTQCLPQMKASDAARLNAGQRRTLLLLLHAQARPGPMIAPQPNFCIAALCALEQIGDAAAIPVVESISLLEPRTPDEKRIRDAALQCLPILRANAGMVAESQTLLRASTPESSAPDMLLRPASFVEEADPQQLLRSSEGPVVAPTETEGEGEHHATAS